jgi:Holliday junction DNA helicase RuvA
MYFYLEGIVAYCDPKLVVIDCGGVGYGVMPTSSVVAKARVGQKMKVYTHLHVREDLFDLYGFADFDEKNCFLMLTSISGVGPKAAMAILSTATPTQLAMSIINEDEKALTVTPGIGKKLAQRIILELKDKLAKQMPPGAELTYARETPC